MLEQAQPSIHGIKSAATEALYQPSVTAEVIPLGNRSLGVKPLWAMADSLATLTSPQTALSNMGKHVKASTAHPHINGIKSAATETPYQPSVTAEVIPLGNRSLGVKPLWAMALAVDAEEL